MKAKIWMLCTVLADENAPAMPVVFVESAAFVDGPQAAIAPPTANNDFS
jgi:hypothetical protein